MELAYINKLGVITRYKEGDEKNFPTHRILTNEEYGKLLKEIEGLRKQLLSKEEQYTMEIEKLKQQYYNVLEEKRKEEETHNDYREQVKKFIIATKTEIDNCREAKDEAERLNVNLKRICRENANAKRGIKPKKEHSGFIVISTAEIFEHYKKDRSIKDVRAYKTIVETPYKKIMELDVAKKQAWNDGLNRFFDHAWSDSNRNDYAEAVKNNHDDKNFVYKMNWRTGKRGYWEIECWHTKPLNSME